MNRHTDCQQCIQLTLSSPLVAAKKCSTARCKLLKANEIWMVECAYDAVGCAYLVGLQVVLEAVEYAESAEFFPIPSVKT